MSKKATREVIYDGVCSSGVSCPGYTGKKSFKFCKLTHIPMKTFVRTCWHKENKRSCPSTSGGKCLIGTYMKEVLGAVTCHHNGTCVAITASNILCPYSHPCIGILCEDGNKCMLMDCNKSHPDGREKSLLIASF
jgi:hypothetical protein